jgi:hypothetical protein
MSRPRKAATPIEESGALVASAPPDANAPTGLSAEASQLARRLAAAILEVLAGLRGPAEAAQVLGISLARYYQVERRALDGLLAGCEPRRRGAGQRGPSELATLRQECSRLRRECARQQALVRAAQRTVGLAPAPAEPPPSPPPTGTSRKRRPRRPQVRALRMANLLREESTAPPIAAETTSPAGVGTPETPPATPAGAEV